MTRRNSVSRPSPAPTRDPLPGWSAAGRNLVLKWNPAPKPNPAAGRNPVPGRSPVPGRNLAPRRDVDPGGEGLPRGRYLRRLAVGIGAGLLFGVSVTRAPGLAVVALLAMVGWPVAVRTGRRRTVDRRLAARSAAAPAVLDLLGAALRAGLNPHKAVLRVAERAPDVLHEDLGLAAAVLRLGGTPAAALREAADRSGLDELRAAAAALEAAERWGAPPAEALAARAEALRTRARLQAEAAAGQAAVRLAFPLVLCFLPAFILTNVELRLQFPEQATDLG
jgi:tight adherence protein C